MAVPARLLVEVNIVLQDITKFWISASSQFGACEERNGRFYAQISVEDQNARLKRVKRVPLEGAQIDRNAANHAESTAVRRAGQTPGYQGRTNGGLINRGRGRQADARGASAAALNLVLYSNNCPIMESSICWTLRAALGCLFLTSNRFLWTMEKIRAT